ncbi:MAG: glycerol kinase GlpK [Myxococcota bacterium]
MTRLLGIDLGTTLCTAVVIDENGRTLETRSAPIPTRYPEPGRVEQDPHDLVRAVSTVVQPLLGTHRIDAVGMDNQGESFLLWDRTTGEPVTPNIVWQDQRGAEVCRELATRVDESALRHKTGLRLDSYFSAPKLTQVLRTRPDLRDAARAGKLLFGTVETWTLWKLSDGRLHVTDPSTASRTLLFDIHHLRWDDELLALFDIPAAILPEVRPSAGHVGTLSLGGLEVHALAVDQQAALFGQACFSSGEAKCTFGTGSFLLMNTGATPRASRHGLLTTVAWQLGTTTSYALDGGIFCAGSAVQWLKEQLHVLATVAESSEVARESTDHDVMVVPTLAGLAAPRWLTQVRGAVFGLSQSSTHRDLVRGTLDGIACQVFEVLRAMEHDVATPLQSLKVDGGPTENAYLMQVLADVLQRPVQVSAEKEATAVGSANLALHALTGIPLSELARRWKARVTYEPRMPASRRDELLERWERAVRAVQAYHQG